MPKPAERFWGLPLPPKGAEFSAMPVGAHRIARDARGRPALLIATESADALDVRLKHLDVSGGLECVVSSPGHAPALVRASVVRCLSDERALQALFLEIAGPLLETLGDSPSGSAVGEEVLRLAEMFRRLSEPARRSVQGLWAEALMIAASPDPGRLVSAWHSGANDTFDFAEGDCRVEVKSALRNSRRHHFHLAQLQPAEGVKAWIASVQVEPTEQGTTLGTLAAEIQAKVAGSPRVAAKVTKVLVEALGEDWMRASKVAFDRRAALESLRLFRHVSVPGHELRPPAGVEGLHFVADLSRAAPDMPEVNSLAGALPYAAPTLALRGGAEATLAPKGLA